MGSRHSRDGDVRPDFAEALCGGMGTSEHESDQVDVGDHSRMPRALAVPANTTLRLAATSSTNVVPPASFSTTRLRRGTAAPGLRPRAL